MSNEELLLTFNPVDKYLKKDMSKSLINLLFGSIKSSISTDNINAQE